jgi:tRNA (mo5U34)-methyltransferase
MNQTLDSALKECPEWFHSIELAPSIVTPGRKSLEQLHGELKSLRLPDLRGKAVLDIGAYDGFFSFAAEKLGATKVVALDHYVWSADMAAYSNDWRESKRSGITLSPPHETHHWRPKDLPGRKPFDLAHKALGSKVEAVVGDFMTMDLAALGQFDVVFFLGVLYHLEEPFEAVKKLHCVTAPGGTAIIETEAMEIPLLGSRPCFEFIPDSDLNNDPTNWWVPNARAIEGMSLAAGFSNAQVLKKRLPSLQDGSVLLRSLVAFLRECKVGRFRMPLIRYRAYAHARKSGEASV